MLFTACSTFQRTAILSITRSLCARLGHFNFAVVSYFGIGVILMISYPLSTVVRIAWGCDLKTTSMTSLGSEPWRPTGTVFSYRMQSLWHAHSPELFHSLSQKLLKMAKLLLEKSTCCFLPAQDPF